ncbi:damage-inducible protein DinB [Methylomonas sp. Kb3]|uniref:DinB family protein n=1 Tax=Methylomonas sp. Kb3 TaxID=1611544 RepID=UPI000C3253A9|nr:DinB family protein [Methylomonas sp. Kb3]PKD38261.1 damage-inducible protein DinB [Methylomonas sp. Kb3]
MNWLENLVLQARYSQWVNQRLYDACASLTDDERKRDRGVFFHSIHGTWNHLLLGDRVWLARLQDQPVQYQRLDLEIYGDFGELRAAQADCDQALLDWVQGMQADDLQRRIAFRSLSAGQDKNLEVVTMLTTLLNHKTHHRGQITALLSQCGCDYGDIDFICAPFVE